MRHKLSLKKGMHLVHRHGMAESNATLTAKHVARRLRSAGFLQNEFCRNELLLSSYSHVFAMTGVFILFLSLHSLTM